VFAAVFLISGCNVFAPFQPDSSDQDHLEEALACLSNNANYNCALTEYNKLSSQALKDQNLCMVNISLAGMTLNNLVNVVVQNSGSSTMIGSLANAVLPWSSAEVTAAAAAAGTPPNTNGECQNFQADAGSGQLGLLLSALSYMVDCTARFARTATQVDDGTGTYPIRTPTNYGTVTQNSICSNPPTCTLSAGTPGLADTDALACSNDIQAVGNLDVGGLSQIQSAIATLNGLGLTTGQTADAVREALRTLLAH